MRFMYRLLVTSTLWVALAGGLQAADYALEQEVGSLEALDEQAARALLVRYSEGRILTYAPVQARVDLLQAIMAASPEGGPTRERARMLMESAKSGKWE